MTHPLTRVAGLLAAISVVAMLLACGVRSNRRIPLKQRMVGKKVPELAGQDLNGRQVKLSQFTGKVVVVDIWVEWCPECMKMLPYKR